MKSKIDIKSRFEFFPIILVIILIISSALIILSYYHSTEVLKQSLLQSMILRTEDNADLVRQQINEFKIIIEGIAFRTSIQTMDWEIQKPILIAEAKRLKIKRFQVVDLNGYAHSSSGKNLDLSDRKWIKKALHGVTNVSEPFVGRIGNDKIFVCATPIKSEEGKIIGALAASINPQYLFDIIKNIKVCNTGYGFIINKKGVIIAHPNIELILSKISDNKEIKSKLESLYEDLVNGGKSFDTYTLDGTDKYMTYSSIPNTDWILVLSAPKNEVFNEANVLKIEFLKLTIVTIIICILSCILIIVYILKKRKILGLEKRVEDDKRLLRESAEIEKIRTQFFANISHEFRTPLNVILSSLQLFKLYFEKENALQSVNLSKHIKTMKQNCYRLLRLVNNLIDTTRIDVGFLEKHMQNHNIVKIIEDITMSIVEFTQMKGINIIFDTDIEEKVIACDVDKIERIMLNLISNAIKFTNYGGDIFVNITDKVDHIVITVTDTGIGIPKDKQEVIFERFVQVEQTLTRKHEGSGIGLSMGKAFVEMHGGTLKVVSEYGKGSEFIIELPVNIVKNGEENNVHSCELESQQRIERINIEFSDIYCS